MMVLSSNLVILWVTLVQKGIYRRGAEDAEKEFFISIPDPSSALPMTCQGGNSDKGIIYLTSVPLNKTGAEVSLDSVGK